ncbi:MAG: response regulator [Rhodospirillales bacterium]|nr:response regulator [Rhodospirillales bacterium]
MRKDPPKTDHAGQAVPVGAADKPVPTRPLFPVVAIGASAGGLDACRVFLRALPRDTGMAFILVQHLDPNHPSMMVDLLVETTTMTVRQAAEGMPIIPDHLYVIPPGAYLGVSDGVLHVMPPEARHGARLPFDHLLHALADAFGARGVCVVLSGTGADGSLGLQSVRKSGGLVMVQDPAEAGYDGMPRNAIATGAVDLVLRLHDMPQALLRHARRIAHAMGAPHAATPPAPQELLAAIIAFLRSRTPHDFTLYKSGTLQRRIERRMALRDIQDMAGYLDLLHTDADELDLLSKDLLINVTSFFRDPRVFDVLAERVIPALLREHPSDQPIRIWVAGCSSGEETYTLVMLFREAIQAAGRDLKLQVFASDVDPDAVTAAREGLYPETIEADVSPERLTRFFVKEEQGYRIVTDLRNAVVFTVQDVLADPPFSRLDLVSCRNLLIYLRPEAQAKVIALFHFALREGGILLLGTAETIGSVEGKFEPLAKSERLYRHIGRARAGDLGPMLAAPDGTRMPMRRIAGQTLPRDALFAELCRRLVIEQYAPAAVLITPAHDSLYSLGPIHRYLRVAPGAPSQNLLAMVGPGLRTAIRAAVQQATQNAARAVVTGISGGGEGGKVRFSVAVHPVQNEGEALLLVCFLDEPGREVLPGKADGGGESPQIAELEQELAATAAELQGAIRNMEISAEEQRAAHEEALSLNEEFQSTNEELLTSKEELQSLNEELTALNTQLQETLERQRTTANDLQNVLYSTNVATLFLDRALRIRFFTPATRALFSVIAGDIGRPLRDLASLAVDRALTADAHAVLEGAASIEREVEAQAGTWFVRRILPYRTQEGVVEGVVITFNDITTNRYNAAVAHQARREAEIANLAKSRFLAAASHDLRQPLQSIALVQGLLAQTVQGERAQKLVARLDDTLGAMAGMLNTLLDINQLEVGVVQPDISPVPINQIIETLTTEFTYHAEAHGLELRVVPCGLAVDTDARLLGQMIRNLLSNAVKYTERGKILLGCRRRRGMLQIEIWDSGIGIAESELSVIFEEYHQIGNPARERSRGLGLGLAIVHRLGRLLRHRVRVCSRPGRGSVFIIEVGIAATQPPPAKAAVTAEDGAAASAGLPVTGTILVVEDDPELGELLELLLQQAGHRVHRAVDAAAALALAREGTLRPDLIVADYNLPGGMDGLQMTAALRLEWRRQVPVIILTGDISVGTVADVARADCLQLYKPVKAPQLAQAIQRLLPAESAMPDAMPGAVPAAPSPAARPPVGEGKRVYVVDDDKHVCDEIRRVLEANGRVVEDFASAEAFFTAYRPAQEACLLLDAYLPGMNGLAVLNRLRETDAVLPTIVITGYSEVAMAVQAMKAGAFDYLEKPISYDDLLANVERAFEHGRDTGKRAAWRRAAALHVAGLTTRQREIMNLVLAGEPNKNIAADLGISQRTVENHRAEIMRRTGAQSLPALVRLAVAASEAELEAAAPPPSSSK